MRQTITLAFVISGLIGLVPFLGLAAEKICLDLEIGHIQDSTVSADRRAALNQFFLNANVPGFSKKTANGEIGVFLVNSESVDRLGDYFDRSIGIMAQLQPNWGTDHGLLRVGRNVIDADSPGERGYGEINGTGLSWREVAGNVKRRGVITKENAEQMRAQGLDPKVGKEDRVEVSYIVTPEQLAVANFYQFIRRAAMFRVSFSGKVKQDINTLSVGSEHCFTFCNGASIGSQVQGIDAKIKALGGASAAEVMQQPKVVEFLAVARAKILEWKPDIDNNVQPPNAWNNKALENTEVNGQKLLEIYQEIFPATVSKENQNEYANWLVSYEAASHYARLMKDLDVGNHLSFNDFSKARPDAVLIYDASEGAKSRFLEAKYDSPGRFGNWDNANQSSFAP